MYTNCMLLVVDGDAHQPVIYYERMKDDTRHEVEKACVIVGINPDEDVTNDIVLVLEADEVYWYADRWCFQIIPIK